jgi:hypothetical protein
MDWKIGAARGNDKLLFLKEKVQFGEEKDKLLNYINILKQTRLNDIYILEHPPHIQVPPNNSYEITYEIRNGFFLELEEIYFLKQQEIPVLLIPIYSK